MQKTSVLAAGPLYSGKRSALPRALRAVAENLDKFIAWNQQVAFSRHVMGGKSADVRIVRVELSGCF